ncbi:hypothetical protein IK112_03080 [Candidatus Saccharibacteria bacterium]|nr:hypothetical protein [Candidatus Saccharibacteria bacterium]
MAKKLKYFLAVLLAALTFGGYTLLNTSNVHAEGQDPILIQISPVKQRVSLAPGSSYSGTFKVQNVGLLPFEYSVYATPFSVTNDNYDPDYDNVTNYSNIYKWITFDKKTESGTLQPGTSVDVVYTVNVPKDAPAGGQYAALMAQTESGNESTATIATVRRVGMILYAAIPGETRESGEIVKNTVNSFYFQPPVSVSTLVKNTGNVEQTATVTVNMWPLFSKETAFSNAEHPTKLDVMPETSRFNAIPWEGAPSLGIFYVEQTVEFAGQTSTVGKLVLICPLWLIFIVFAIIFFAIFWLISRARDRKRAAARVATTHSVKSDSHSETSTKATKSKKDKEE